MVAAMPPKPKRSLVLWFLDTFLSRTLIGLPDEPDTPAQAFGPYALILLGAIIASLGAAFGIWMSQ